MITLEHPMPPTSKRRNSSRRNNRPQKISTSRGLVRIIAGTHRGRRLPVLVHDGLRPTGDRVKETLFNWLMSAIPQAVCLDMYAGSGGLGIEALSRGANFVVFVEQDKTVAQQIDSNLAILKEQDKASVLQTSALSDANTLQPPANSPYNIVFIDPPFGENMIANSLNKLVENNLLATNAYVYIESAHSDVYEVPNNFVLHKQIKTSQVMASLYVCQG